VPSFGERLSAVFADRGQLCLGLDPHAFLLESWGLPDSAAGVRELSLRVVDAAAREIGIIKPQIAFFERHGAAGYAVLEEVIASARSAGLLVIADVKRGDIGSTISAYAEAWLTPGKTLEVDAITLSAFQGVGSITDPIARAATHGKGVFVLAATSNPEAFATQTAVLDSGVTVAAGIVEEVRAINGEATLGSVGVVIGATVNLEDFGIDPAALTGTPILGPGFGEQGALLSELPNLYGAVRWNVVANVGRSVLRAGASGIDAELARHADELRKALAS
jgi:orotidine-5'-phosphate decarboxylase